jgi:hypothetical protein
MATTIEFSKPSGRKVAITVDGVLIRSFDISQDITIKPLNDNIVQILAEGNVYFDFDWRDVITPAQTSREALILDLLTNFFFDDSVEARVEVLENLTIKIAYYAEITTVSGAISKPVGSTILLDQWANGVDALVSAIPNGSGTPPDYEFTGIVVTSFDTDGNYSISDALPTNPSALIYYVTIPLKSFANLNTSRIIEYVEIKGLTQPIEFLTFDTAYTGEPTTESTIYWNSDEQTLNVVLPNGVVGQMFQETFFDVINKTGSQLNNITPVMFAGTLGVSGKLLPQLAIADGSLPPEYSMGLVTEDLANDGEGKITWFGKVRGVNTTGSLFSEVWNDGDLIYISAVTAGYLTNVKPNAPHYQILVAVVIKAHTNGTLFVRPTWKDKLTDLSDVNGTALTTTGQIAVWDNVNGYFDFIRNIDDYRKILNPPTIVSTAAYTVLDTDYFIQVTRTLTGDCTITLPTTGMLNGREIGIKTLELDTLTYNVTIETGGSELIEGETNLILVGYGDCVILYSDGSNWYIKN